MTQESLASAECEGRARHAPGNYAAIAREYYDPDLHPNSAALRDLSIEALRRNLPLGPVDRVLELGSGRTVFADLESRPRRLVLLDRSETMLNYSDAPGASKLLGDARLLPVKGHSIDGVVAMLGDPYNSPELWQEVARVLRHGGWAAYTTPSSDWSRLFRQGEGTPPDVARFVRRDGLVLDLPSIVRPVAEQESWFREAGLAVHRRVEVRAHAAQRIKAPKLTVNAEHVVTAWFLAHDH
jgi:SAM-dependent methyltransferase